MTRRIVLFPIWLCILLLLPALASAQDIKVITNREYFNVVHKAIKEAKNSIKVMMFEVGYYEEYPNSPSNILITDLIKARKRGVEVEVILEIGTWPRVDDKNRKVGRILSKNGVKVKYDSIFVTTHAKLLIIDDRISIVGSTNWTYYSLTQNNEVCVLIDSKEVACKLGEYFKKVWESG